MIYSPFKLRSVQNTKGKKNTDAGRCGVVNGYCDYDQPLVGAMVCFVYSPLTTSGISCTDFNFYISCQSSQDRFPFPGPFCYPPFFYNANSVIPYYVSSCPSLWPILFAYYIWICFIDKSPERGGRPSKWFRSSRFWRYFADYYPAS